MQSVTKGWDWFCNYMCPRPSYMNATLEVVQAGIPIDPSEAQCFSCKDPIRDPSTGVANRNLLRFSRYDAEADANESLHYDWKCVRKIPFSISIHSLLEDSTPYIVALIALNILLVASCYLVAAKIPEEGPTRDFANHLLGQAFLAQNSTLFYLIARQRNKVFRIPAQRLIPQTDIIFIPKGTKTKIYAKESTISNELLTSADGTALVDFVAHCPEGIPEENYHFNTKEELEDWFNESPLQECPDCRTPLDLTGVPEPIFSKKMQKIAKIFALLLPVLAITYLTYKKLPIEYIKSLDKIKLRIFKKEIPWDLHIGSLLGVLFSFPAIAGWTFWTKKAKNTYEQLRSHPLLPLVAAKYNPNRYLTVPHRSQNNADN